MVNISNDAKISLVERATWEGIQKRAENHVVIESNWVQQTTPHAPTAFLNGVYKCEISDNSIIGRVRDTITHYNQLKLPFRWKIGPFTKPASLATLLTENGMYHKETLFGLWGDPQLLQIPLNSQVAIKELTSDTLEDWLSVQASAWHVPPQGIEHLRRTQLNALMSGDATILNYIAYVENVPIGSAGLRFYSDYALLMGAAVNPANRRHGVYRSLLAHRMNLIQERSLPAVIHCLEHSSAPICLKLGFEKVCEIQSFEMPET